METINLTLCRATRSGRIDRAYLGGLTTEAIVVKWDDGETLPEGTQLALYLGETLCASAETDETGTATLNTDTQELAEAFDGLPVDYALSFRLFLGDADTILAIVPAQVKKNWLDDAASHPPAPLPEYWTKAEVQAAIDAHAGRTDNPHEVTAAQVPYGEAEARNATLAGADNWNGAWGFDLDLKTLDAAAWEGIDPETAVKVSEICLRVSERDYTGDLVWLELTGTDGKVWVSQDEPSWVTRGAEVPYRFEPAAELPGGVIAARFVTTNGKGFGHAMPLRVSKVSTTETPAGCDVWTADKGTSKRTDFAPCVVRLDYSFPATVAVALGNLESGKSDVGHLHDDRYLRLTGGTLRGNVNASGVSSVTIKVPILHATSYFSTPMLCNEPGQYAKNHALLLGYAYHDYWEFLENGGDYRFYMHQETAGIHKQVARITEAGIYEGSTLLANKYAAKSHTHTQAQVTGLTAALQDVKDYADQRVAGAYRYKGTVANKGALPSSGNTAGDVWNVSEDGMNYAWDGTAWDALGATVDLSAYSTTAQADDRYLKLSGGTVTGNVTLNGADNYMRALRFGGSAQEAGLKTRGICGWNAANQKNGLFLNYDGRDVPTEEYFSAGEKRGVYICGGNDATNQTCLALRKMDGDYFYAAKAQTYTKSEVDEKISSALGDIQAALAAI